MNSFSLSPLFWQGKLFLLVSLGTGSHLTPERAEASFRARPKAWELSLDSGCGPSPGSASDQALPHASVSLWQDRIILLNCFNTGLWERLEKALEILMEKP